jgi:hypothetical protein
MRVVGVVTLAAFIGWCGSACKEEQSGPAGAAGIGVPGCDAYFERWTHCANNVEAASKQALLLAVERNRAQWLEMAKQQERRAGLAKLCEDSLRELAKNPACRLAAAP